MIISQVGIRTFAASQAMWKANAQVEFINPARAVL